MRLAMAFLLAALLGACAEPDHRVTRYSDDGLFELSLEADENQVRPGGELPVLVRLEYQGPPLREERIEEIELVANNGSLSENLLVAVFAAAPSGTDELPQPYRQWVVFSASTRLLPVEQGEVRALWNEVQAVLKIRVNDDPSELLDE